MLNAHGALVLTSATRGALKHRFLGDVLGEQRLGALRAVFIQIVADTQRDFARVEDFAGVEGWTMLGAAPALDARISLQRDKLRDVFPRIESEILVTNQRWNLAEAIALEEDGHRAQDQVQM